MNKLLTILIELMVLTLFSCNSITSADKEVAEVKSVNAITMDLDWEQKKSTRWWNIETLGRELTIELDPELSFHDFKIDWYMWENDIHYTQSITDMKVTEFFQYSANTRIVTIDVYKLKQKHRKYVQLLRLELTEFKHSFDLTPPPQIINAKKGNG